VATASAITSDTSATGGTAAKFKVTDSDSNIVFSGTVGTSGADLNLSSLAIGAGDTVSVSSFTYTAST
jgi:dTDP-4-amino-4,6-dideoxygalactose transaminase